MFDMGRSLLFKWHQGFSLWSCPPEFCDLTNTWWSSVNNPSEIMARDVIKQSGDYMMLFIVTELNLCDIWFACQSGPSQGVGNVHQTSSSSLVWQNQSMLRTENRTVCWKLGGGEIAQFPPHFVPDFLNYISHNSQSCCLWFLQMFCTATHYISTFSGFWNHWLLLPQEMLHVQYYNTLPSFGIKSTVMCSNSNIGKMTN